MSAPLPSQDRDPQPPDGEPVGAAERGLLRSFALLLLASQPTHGYRLSRQLEEAGLRPGSGGLYHLLVSLEREGSIESYSSGAGTGSSSSVYHVTAHGLEQLRAEAGGLEQMAELLASFSSRYAALPKPEPIPTDRSSSEAARPAPPIDEVGLSPRAVELLRRSGLRTLEEIAVLTEWELSRKGLWVGDLRKIVAALARVGLSLRDGTRGGPPRDGRARESASDSAAARLRPPGRRATMPHTAERDAAIVLARAQGDTLQEIGARFGLSRERVRQILSGTGADDIQSSRRARAERRRAAAEERRPQVFASWRAGSGVNQIAAELGLPRASVKALIDRYATADDRDARRLALFNAARCARPRGYSDEQLLGAVGDVVEQVGRVPTSSEYAKIAREAGLPSLSTVENRFGGWKATLRAIGHPAPPERGRRYRRRWTEERCLQALRELVAELGRLPSQAAYRELSARREDLPSSATLRTRLGSWSTIGQRLHGEDPQPDQLPGALPPM